MATQISAAPHFSAIAPQRSFAALEWRATLPSNDRLYRYRLYEPPQASKDKPLPLVVYLHGYGEHGEDNISSLRHVELLFESTGNLPPFFILVTQHHTDEMWTSAAAPESDALSVTYKIMERTLSQFPVDPDRIYVIGISAGGTACWELGCRHPDRFAALVPLASAGADSSPQIAHLLKIPIWAFHTRTDLTTRPDGDRTTIQAIQRAGGIAQLTETEKTDVNDAHNCWSTAFIDYHVLDWLLTQHRGQHLAKFRWVVFRGVDWLNSNELVVFGWISVGVCIWLSSKYFNRKHPTKVFRKMVKSSLNHSMPRKNGTQNSQKLRKQSTTLDQSQ